MSYVAAAVVASNVIGGALASDAQSSASDAAASATRDSSAATIEESKRQFNSIQELLRPYTSVGLSGLSAQKDLIGLNGPNAQRTSIDSIANGPTMQALTQQGENAILSNASATGGLRGGNVQQALSQFRPQILSQLLQQQYSNLGGLTSIGQNAAAGVGNAGQNSSNQIIGAIQQTGAANAGQALADGKAQADLYGGISGTVGTLGTLKLLGKF